VSKSQGRLADWSYAGYQGQAEPIPDLPIVVEVSEFGGVGDGNADDSQAINDALDAAAARGGGAVHLPAGKYRISSRINIASSNVVLRGDGPTDTVLLPTGSLADIDGVKDIKNKWGNRGTATSPYSWFDGFLSIRGPPSATGDYQANPNVDDRYIPGAELLTVVTADAPAGSRTLYVQHPERVTPGMLVRLMMSDPPADGSAGTAGSLGNMLYNDAMRASCSTCDRLLKGVEDLVRFPSRCSLADEVGTLQCSPSGACLSPFIQRPSLRRGHALRCPRWRHC
jgi:hypothetical protein